MGRLCAETLAYAILVACKENEFTNCEMKDLVRKLEGMIDDNINKQRFSFRNSDKIKEMLVNHGHFEFLPAQNSVNSNK